MLDLRDSTTYQEILAEGEAKGRLAGRTEGLQEGVQEGKEELLSILLEQRFSTLPDDLTQRLDKLTSEQMNELAKALLSFTSLDDLENWLIEQ